MNWNLAFVIFAAQQDPKQKFVKSYIGPSVHEVLLSDLKSAKKYQPSLAVRVAECLHEAVRAGRPVPQMWLSAQAVYEDGSLVAGSPASEIPVVRQKSKAPQIPELPEVAPCVQLADGSWRVVPEMSIKYSQNGSYFSVPYAFIYKNSPLSGFFAAPTKRDLFDVIFDVKNDAQPDGRGGWLNPRDPRVPGEPTKEQIYRSLLPVAPQHLVDEYQAMLSAHDAAVAAAEYELNREPTEAEIQAVDVSEETLNRMPAAVLKDKVLSDKAFARAYERRERAMEAFRIKEQKEREKEMQDRAAREARQRLADRERGVLTNDGRP